MPTSLPPQGSVDKKIGAYTAPLSVSAQDLPNLTVKVRAGSFFNSSNIFTECVGGTTPLITPPVTSPKWVIVTVSDLGVLTIVNGTEATAPSFPAIPTGNLPLAAIYLVPGTVAIGDSLIVDVRPFLRSSDIIPNLTTTLASLATTNELVNALALKADVDGIPGNVLTLNKNGTSLPTTSASVVINRGASLPSVSIRWNETLGHWEVTNDGATYSPIVGAALVHHHVAADITDFSTAVNALIGTASINQSQVLNLSTALSAKANVASPVFTGAVGLPSYVKTALPAAITPGEIIFVSNATGLHVVGSICFSNGTNWIDLTTGNIVV